jgi:hypothetical protein
MEMLISGIFLLTGEKPCKSWDLAKLKQERHDFVTYLSTTYPRVVDKFM